MPKTAPLRWSQNNMATLLGFSAAAWSHILAGQMYPARLQQLQRIETVLGWPVAEQVQLIPPYWEWPEQQQSGPEGITRYFGEPTDLRYAIKLARVVSEWGDAHPRTVPTRDVTMHPSIPPFNKTPRTGFNGGRPGGRPAKE